MKIISVAGATSKAGKTLLAQQLIEYCAAHYHPVYAVKFTTASDVSKACPRGAPCTVCDLSENFRIVRDPEILRQKGKNTARFYDANATDVVWVISRASQLHAAYSHLPDHIPANAVVIMEGSSITSIIRPELLFYVYANHIPESRWKDSAKSVMNRADFIVRNQKPNFPSVRGNYEPERFLDLNLLVQPITSVAEVRDKIDIVLGSLVNAIQPS